jgi:hypothetical protein
MGFPPPKPPPLFLKVHPSLLWCAPLEWSPTCMDATCKACKGGLPCLPPLKERPPLLISPSIFTASLCYPNFSPSLLSLSHSLHCNLAASICNNILWIIKEALEDLLCAIGVFLVLLHSVLFEVILLHSIFVFLAYIVLTWRPKQSILLGKNW